MEDWNLQTNEKIDYITVPQWRSQGVVQAFSIRKGGVSQGIYASLNMGLHVGDLEQRVLENRIKLTESFQATLADVVCCEQVHGSAVRVVNGLDKGKGALRLDEAIPGYDAMITSNPGIYLMTFYADCVPVYYFDPVHRSIGLAHCGWKGTMGKIAQKTLEAMQTNFNSEASQVQVFIGPGIGPCCFEIKPDLAAKVYEEFSGQSGIITSSDDGRFTWDLQRTNALVLEAMGVKSNNIIICSLCTACEPDLFFSYRRDAGATGRMAALIGLKY